MAKKSVLCASIQQVQTHALLTDKKIQGCFKSIQEATTPEDIKYVYRILERYIEEIEDRMKRCYATYWSSIRLPSNTVHPQKLWKEHQQEVFNYNLIDAFLRLMEDDPSAGQKLSKAITMICDTSICLAEMQRQTKPQYLAHYSVKTDAFSLPKGLKVTL